MIQIDQTIISDDLLTEYFLCDLQKCKGACCEEGDSGAPLQQEEIDYIVQHFDQIAVYLSDKHIQAVREQGFFFIDEDGDKVTTLVDEKQCVYSFRDDQQILRCAIEAAYEAGIIPKNKPISCHLFPSRIKSYEGFDAINYAPVPICKPALINGKAK